MNNKNKLDSAPLIFVWIGNSLPSWCKRALILNSNLNDRDVILIGSSVLKSCIPEDIKFFELESFYDSSIAKIKINTLNSDKRRSGFWQKTYERFFVLNTFMKKYDIKYFFHAELDNICMIPEGLEFKIDQFGLGCYVPQDSESRAIASLIYINNIYGLEFMCNIADDILVQYSNEMELLAYCLNKSDHFYPLPTESHLNGLYFSKNADLDTTVKSLGGIFDAASFGQYILGIDARNSTKLLVKNKFENELSCNNWEETYFSVDDLGKSVSVRIADKNYKLMNLHIHSKIFPDILSLIYLNDIFINLNNNKSNIVQINIKGFVRGNLSKYLIIIRNVLLRFGVVI